MTSILAAVTFEGSDVPPTVVQRMADAAPHRMGSSQPRMWQGEGAVLAHAVGRSDVNQSQPVCDDSLVCVADARIDNRGEVRAALRVSEATTSTITDAQLILSAYRRWGTMCVERLLGDFSFVIWDASSRSVFAARDAMGARSLYYRSEARRRVLVATEAKQILAAPGVPRDLNETALLADIAGLLALPSMTPFRGIDQLAPAHAMAVDHEGLRIWRYWDIDPGHRIRYGTGDEYAEHFGTLIADSVGARTRADKPVGMFLSGGLDAISVAATATASGTGAQRSRELRGYSWAFEKSVDDDERHVSRIVAEACGIDVTDVPGDDAWPLRDLPEHGPDLDDPYIRLYQPLVERTLAIARQQGVVSMLTTDRGDEMVGNWVFDDLGLLVKGRLSALLADARAYMEQRNASSLAYALERIAKPLFTTMWPPGSFERLRTPLQYRLAGGPKPRPPWVPTRAAQRLDLADVAETGEAWLPVRSHARAQRYSSVFHIVSQRVAQAHERTFARHGLIYADPWGDRRIAEFVCAAPQWRVQRHSRPKMLTQEAVRGVVPEAARRNPARRNPVGLFRRAFNERETETVRAMMRDSRAEAAGLLDAKAVLQVFESYLQGQDVSHDFWHPLCVEMWLRRWWD